MIRLLRMVLVAPITSTMHGSPAEVAVGSRRARCAKYAACSACATGCD